MGRGATGRERWRAGKGLPGGGLPGDECGLGAVGLRRHLR